MIIAGMNAIVHHVRSFTMSRYYVFYDNHKTTIHEKNLTPKHFFANPNTLNK